MTLFKDMPIQRKLMRILFLISGVVVLVTCVTFFIYERHAFRKTTEEKLSTIGKIIAANSTAALAFDNRDDAKEILAALKTEPYIVAAALYDKDGNLFTQYQAGKDLHSFPAKTGQAGYGFTNAHLEGFEPVLLEDRPLGTLYLKSGLGAMYERLKLYGIIVALVILLSFSLAWLLSRVLQKSISRPVLNLAATAKMISGQDYSVRAVKMGNDELGALTEAFNTMLDRIGEQTQALQDQQRQEQVKIITTTLDAQEKERTLIGQELHDNVNQLLVGTKLFLSRLKDVPEKNKELIDICMQTIQQAIDENRRIAHALVAPDFEVRMLSELITDLSESMLKSSGIEISLDIAQLNDDELEEEQKLAVYRIAQEQCANIVKHAKASHVHIYLGITGGQLKMLINDNGAGMEPGKPNFGIGLKNIKNRLSTFNGTVNICSSPGDGFNLEVLMPLKNTYKLESRQIPTEVR